MTKTKAPRKPKTPTALSSRMGQYLTVERVIIGGSLLVTVAIIGIIALNAWLNRPIAIEGVQRVAVLQGHQETPVNYQQTPPAGGLHYPIWQNCAVYAQSIEDEFAVHSLEHGAVWITYDPTVPQDQVETLQSITRGGTHRLLSPYSGLSSPIVVSAWGYQLQLESATDDRLVQFVRQYERGSQSPEPGASCSGGESRSVAEMPSR